MDFFGNIWNGVKNVASSVYNGINSAASSIGNVLSAPINGVNNLANAISSNLTDNSSIQPYKNVPGVDPKTGQPNMTYDLNALSGKTTPQGTLYYDNQGRQVALNSSGQTDVVKTLNNNVTTQNNQMLGSLGISPGGISYPRPMINDGPTLGTNSNGQTFNPTFGAESYWDPINKVQVTPTQGYSGGSGSSSGQNFNSLAATPTTGANGLSGGSNFTGTLSATGYGVNSPFAGLAQTEEDKKRKDFINKLLNNPSGSTLQGPNPITGGITTPMVGGSPTPTSIVAPQKTPAPLQTPAVSNITDATSVTAPQNTALKTSYANNSNDVAHTNDTINNNFNAEKQRLDQQYPTDKGPLTTDTPEQLQFMQGQGDPYGVKAALDAYKTSNTQLSTLEASRLETMKSIQALQSAYQPIIDDIKNNPDLPKGLAARRLTDLNVKQKEVLLGFQNQLSLTNQSIDDQNQQVNRAFNIVQFSQGQADKAQDNARQLLQVMISSGAIGGMTDKELAQLSANTGIAISGLQKARTNANDPAKNIETSTNDNGTVTGIDKTTGKVVWTLANTGKTSSSAGGGAGGDPAYADSLASNIINRRVDYNSLPASDKKLVTQTLGSQGLLIPRALTAKEKDAQDNATSGLAAVQQLRSQLNSGGLPLSADALTPNAFGLGTAIGNTIDPRLSSFRNSANEATDIKTRIRTGAALNESEISFYANQRPTLGDKPADVKKKLDNLEGFYLGMSGLPVTVTSKSGSYTFQDLYDSKQRLGLRQAIDAGYSLSY